jgi:hypothetical protein
MAQGVYPWAPTDVRNALLAAIGRLLAPQGVAFVSYLALPGAHMRELVRTIIRFHTSMSPTSGRTTTAGKSNKSIGTARTSKMSSPS